MPYGPNHIKQFLFFVTLIKSSHALSSFYWSQKKFSKSLQYCFKTFAIYLLAYFFDTKSVKFLYVWCALKFMLQLTTRSYL